MNFLVTRHAGARDWVDQQQGGSMGDLKIDAIASHLEIKQVQEGDVVVGTLPIGLVAAVNRKGARYIHLDLRVPAEARGKELTAEDMTRYGAKLQEYEATKID